MKIEIKNFIFSKSRYSFIECARHIRGAVKKSLEFFDINDLMHHEFVPPGQSVTGHSYEYFQVLQRLCNAVRKRRYKWHGQWFLYHNKAPSHTSFVQQFLAEKNISVITQPPHSPDLAPSYFWLLTTLKMSFKGTSFATVDIKWKNGMLRSTSGRFQVNPSAGDSNDGRIDGASVCVLKEGD
jgi:hypothetical protein